MDLSFDQTTVVEQLGLGKQNPEFQQQMTARVFEIAHERLGQRFQMEMTPEDYQVLDEIGNDAQQQSWLAQRFPEYDNWFGEEVQSIVSDMKTQADAAVAAVHTHRQQK